MIERDIRQIIEDPQQLARFAEELRENPEGKLCQLLALLNADHAEVVRIGAWISGEVKIDPAVAQPLISRLQQLLDHEEGAIRFYAVGGLFPFIDGSNPADIEMLISMSKDSNKGVRIAAQSALTRLSRR